jgi:hypothetical protein
MRTCTLSLALALLAACAHSSSRRAEDLQPAVRRFHERVRWRDWPSVARLMVPELRGPFLEARNARRDEQDLSITDYEVLEVGLTDEAQRAVVRSRIRWLRLPSPSEQTALVTSEFVWRDGDWLLERQQGGPFDGELP